MTACRRSFMLRMLAASISLPAAAAAAAAAEEEARSQSVTRRQPESDLPDRRKFQSGDLIWPKKKGAIVPRSGTDLRRNDDHKAWVAAREAILRADPAKSQLSPELAEKLRNMSYSEFEALYFASPSEPIDTNAWSRKSTSPRQTIYVGHVGIIDMAANGAPFVIEATVEGLKGAVVRTSYAEWLKGHNGKQVWHGRIRRFDSGLRKRIAQEARKQLGKPYSFFNFNLDDDTAFYCSKLVWMSVWRATLADTGTGPVAIDGNANPRRPFFGWFSPKQLANAERVELLFSPSEY